ncbi:xanthine dehydrogenase accessory protein XdhC [Tropicimonas marinistellae]|uniref:xanthine dehydrogenase accessory protein XdhC n=1 Tax=Tropicimonas marinistellae TaxID=1739787 RepID=UPI0008361441|nr:xanthine dehydrogenase accessory protein XdhC [Tropicimonas marinistellae]
MSFDAQSLKMTVARHGRVARVVVTEVSGSAPREAGASMLVWKGGQSGTIGGGALELEATTAARNALSQGNSFVMRHPLGPALGQCCGGAVTLATEVWDAASLESRLDTARDGWVIRPVGSDSGTRPQAGTMPLRRLLRALRNGSVLPGPWLQDGWLAEPLSEPRHRLWLHGAGHVGRAIAATLAPLPEWTITWIDTHATRFPDMSHDTVDVLVAEEPARVVAHAPPDAHHLILTYSHALDLALCRAVLKRGFASAGLIGSATKWRRFRNRLLQLGHSESEIARITCPIGDPALGKHPQAIAIGATAMLLRTASAVRETAVDRTA